MISLDLAGVGVLFHTRANRYTQVGLYIVVKGKYK